MEFFFYYSSLPKPENLHIKAILRNRKGSRIRCWHRKSVSFTSHSFTIVLLSKLYGMPNQLMTILKIRFDNANPKRFRVARERLFSCHTAQKLMTRSTPHYLKNIGMGAKTHAPVGEVTRHYSCVFVYQIMTSGQVTMTQ